MTQNTQTTTERITALIFDAIRMDSTTFETVDAECATIAAEIDGLRDEMAVILRERDEAHLALAEARNIIAANSKLLHDAGADFDRMMRERDEARDQAAGLDAGMRFQFDRAEDYKAQRDEARAEVGRLRPAAEAWEAEERYRNAERLLDAGRLAYVFPFSAEYLTARDACDAARSAFNATAARARAAKEAKP